MSAPSSPETVRTNPQAEAAENGKAARLAGKLAALTGAAGALLSGEAGAEASGITYTPTAGVAAAQNIPGFSFTFPTTVTPGELRPPSSTGNTFWDIDGNGQNDFALDNGFVRSTGTLPLAVLRPLSPFTANPNGLLASQPAQTYLLNLGQGAAVDPLAVSWRPNLLPMTYNGSLPQFMQDNFELGTTGYFGFRFAFNNVPTNYYYGWASLTITGSSGSAAVGQGFTIGEAFYQTTPNTAITVGDVPLDGVPPVPELSGEPSGIALLAAGFFGLEALRARRRRSALAC